MGAKWIWNGTEASENLYVVARTQFECPAETQAELLVSADSDFAAFLNGKFLGRGQFSDFPDAKTFTRIPVTAAAGKNLLEIRAYYCGENFLNHLKGTPRLWAEVRSGDTVLTATGRNWEIAEDPAFRSGPIEKLNPMLGYTWEHDARKNIPVFSAAAELAFKDVPAERPVPMILPGEPIAEQTVWHGYFKRRRPEAFPGAAMASDMVTPLNRPFNGTFAELPEDSDGWLLIVDLGRESAGLLHFEVEAAAGTVLDIAHGEHLELGRVLCASGNCDRTYGDRYICREGSNVFTFYFRRYGARYLEMHISNVGGPVRVRRFTLLPTDLKLPAPAEFHSEDRLLEATHRIGIRTLELCMHEHYEDCPWREQSLYGYDSRNQMLFGYYAFGNYSFAAASLNLLGDSMLENGFLNLTAPGDLKLSIPVFTFAWLAALREHELYSGSRAPYLHSRTKILDAVPKFMARRTPEGLFLPPPDPPGRKTWNFCEWVDGLNGQDPPEKDMGPTAFYNLYLTEALRAVGELERDEGLLRTADELGKRTEEYFWLESEGCYATRRNDGRLHSHIQYLMLALGLVPEERRQRVLKAAASPRLIGITFSPYIYLIRALTACGMTAELNDKLRQDFDRMTLAGATSFWEVAEGARGFGSCGGSLCHGWSCAGIYFDGAFRLGITPLEPGFRTFSVAVHPAGLSSLEGEVPTPYGPIRIRWKVKDDGTIAVNLKHPAETRPAFIADGIRME